MLKNTPKAAIVAATLLFSINSNAAQQLEDMVVTGTRTAVSIEDSVVPVEVIKREDIDLSSAKTLPQLLADIAGVSIASNGGMGSTTSLFFRGTNSGHVLVLIDGVRINSVSSGGAAIQDISLANIDRIEIIRGSRSSLYGSDAIGGVIQIFTKNGKNGNKGFSPSVNISSASKDYHDVGFSVSGQQDGFYTHIAYNRIKSEGQDCTNENNIGHNPDKDGYENNSMVMNVGKQWQNGTELNLNFQGTNAMVEYDGSWPSVDVQYHSNTANRQHRLKFITPVFSNADISFDIGEYESSTVAYANGIEAYSYASLQRQQLVQIDYQPLESLELVIGNENRQEIAEDYDIGEKKTRAVFAQGLFTSKYVNILGGYRSDRFTGIGDEETYSLGAKIIPVDTLSFNIGFGKSYKAPTINQLYYNDPMYNSYGNPDLLPEKATNGELGIELNVLKIKARINYFRTEIDDLIQWVYAEDYSSISENLNKAEIKGFEAEVDIKSKYLDIHINATKIDAEDISNLRALAKRPEKKLSLTAISRIGRLQQQLKLNAVGKSYEYLYGGQTVELSGYATVDYSSIYRITDQLALKATMSNIFDKEYSTSYGYTSPERELKLSIKFTPLK